MQCKTINSLKYRQFPADKVGSIFLLYTTYSLDYEEYIFLLVQNITQQIGVSKTLYAYFIRWRDFHWIKPPMSGHAKVLLDLFHSLWWFISDYERLLIKHRSKITAALVKTISDTDEGTKKFVLFSNIFKFWLRNWRHTIHEYHDKAE